MKKLKKYIKKWFHTKDGIEQNEINKQLVVIVVSIFFTVVSVLGVTYSAFVWSDNSLKEQNIVSGNVKLDIDSASEPLGSGLNYPVPASEEASLTPYTFTITNTGSIASNYDLKIKSDDAFTNTLDTQYIYMSLDGAKTITRTSIKTYEEFPLDSGTLAPGESKTYNLRLWIIEDAPNSVIGKEWHGKIVLDSSQTVEYYNSFEKAENPLLANTIANKKIGDFIIHGNSVQETDNLFDKTTMISGFLPSSGAYPTTNSSYPNSSYQIIDIKAGQTFKTYGSTSSNGRIRYIDNDTNEVVGTITNGSTDYYTSTVSYNNSFAEGQITAKKDFKLGILYLQTISNNFNLKVVNTTPEPDAPIEIESVGNTNLFNADALSYFDKQEDGSYLSNTKITTYHLMENLKGVYTISAKIKSEVGKNYRITVKYTDGTTTDSYKASTGEYLSYKFTTNGKDIDYIYWNYSISSTNVQFKDLQIEKGSIAHDYVPYGKYSIPLTINGKNLFNKDNYNVVEKLGFNGSGTGVKTGKYKSSTNAIQRIYYIECNPNTTYTISKEIGSVIRVLSSKSIPANDVECQTDMVINGVNKITYTTREDDKYLGLYLQSISETLNINELLEKVQVEEGSTATDYESYKEPQSYNIILNEPLRKVGDYADYIDFENKKIVRNIAKYVLNGDDKYNGYGWASSGKFSSGLNSYGLVMSQLYHGADINHMGPGMCSHFRNELVNSNLVLKTTPQFSIRYGTWRGLIFAIPDSLAPDLDSWKAYLKSEYDSGNPVTVYGVLKEPITEENIPLPTLKTVGGKNKMYIDTLVPATVSGKF
ncbi:MAG: hypothetical protein E7166_02980 [Firmicutes bacterium]|nr:hypothetical protein [Bacillota bacterium]